MERRAAVHIVAALRKAINFLRFEFISFMLLQIQVFFICTFLHYLKRCFEVTSSRCILSFRYPIFYCFRPVELRYEIILKCVEIENAENESEDYHNSFFETSNVSKPIEEIVNLSIDSMIIQIEFVWNCDMNVIEVLIWPLCIRHNAEDISFNLRDRAYLNDSCVLQLKLCDLHLLSHLYSFRAFDWIPFYSGFWNYS